MKIYFRNKKNSIEEHYTILGLLQQLGGNLSGEELTPSDAKEFYYLEDDGNGKMIIRTTDATNLENGEIYTVDEFLSKYETNSNLLVDRIHGNELYPSELLCTVIKEVQCTVPGAEGIEQKVLYGILQDNNFSLIEADNTVLKIIDSSKEKNYGTKSID